MADEQQSGQLIVADSSPLIALALLNILPELKSLCDEILLPETVVMECTRNLSLPGALKIQAAITSKVLTVAPDVELSKKAELQTVAELVDQGEAQAIAIAYQKKATLLIDDKAGRRCANQLAIPIIGSLGVLLRLKELGQIAALKPLLEKLHKSGYWYHPALIQSVLNRSGE